VIVSASNMISRLWRSRSFDTDSLRLGVKCGKEFVALATIGQTKFVGLPDSVVSDATKIKLLPIPVLKGRAKVIRRYASGQTK
jgi:hypothetical protein